MSSFFPDSKTEDFRNSVIDSLDSAHQKINLILKYLNIFYEKDVHMAYDISTLVTAVQNEKTVEASLLALVQGLSQKVASMAANVIDETTKATLADLANQLNENASQMSAAVTAGTPVATTPTTNPVNGTTPADPTNATPPADSTNTTETPTVVTPAASTTQS